MTTNLPMHVLYVHQHFGTPSGAGGIRSYGFAQKLLARGHAVTMVCGSTDRSTTTLTTPFVNGRRSGVVDGIQVIEYDISYSTSDGLLRRSYNFARFAIKASGVALSSQYDLTFATSTPLTVVIAGVTSRLFKRKPFVFEVRDLWPELPKALGLRNPVAISAMSFLEWLGYNVSNHVIALAPGMTHGITRRGCPAGRVTMVPNGCDNDLFDDEVAISPHDMFPKHFDRTDFVAVFAGAHGLANGLDAVLNMAIVLKRRQANHIKIALVGSGATKAALIKRAEMEELKNVVFIDPMPKRQLIRLLKGCDAGLQVLKNVEAFYDGTSPNKFFDYLAAGIPVIVNYPGWIAELVRKNSCGRVAVPDDAEAFADELISAAADRQNFGKLGQNGKVLAQTEFDRDLLANRFCTVLEQSYKHHPVKWTHV
jgi:glycosyltransferase involved in cell wall biosynthesis